MWRRFSERTLSACSEPGSRCRTRYTVAESPRMAWTDPRQSSFLWCSASSPCAEAGLWSGAGSGCVSEGPGGLASC